MKLVSFVLIFLFHNGPNATNILINLLPIIVFCEQLVLLDGGTPTLDVETRPPVSLLQFKYCIQPQLSLHTIMYFLRLWKA